MPKSCQKQEKLYFDLEERSLIRRVSQIYLRDRCQYDGRQEIFYVRNVDVV
jgi:hypothetical protein